MTRIGLLRHYPTDWNREGRLQGQVDRPLNDEARDMLAQVRLPEEWAGVRIIASGLSRTVDTARLLAPGTEILNDRRLMEIAWGAWEGHRSADLLADPSSDFVPTGDMGWRDRPPGGESMADAWERVQPALAEIAADGPALLVIHKAIMRVILGFAHKWQVPGGEIQIKRGRIYPLTLRENGMPVQPEEPIRLVKV
ncbi:MAG: histidine phosphatase family protein [Pseudomonadota bacterium]